MTAWTLVCLRRFEDPIGTEFEPHRRWLAARVLDSSEVKERIHYAALVGIALTPPQLPPHESKRIEEARVACDRQIRDWRRQRRGPVEVSRPVFEGFNLGRATDYTFLNPEVLASLYLMRRGNPKPTRRFVLKVIGEIQANVPDQRGFVGQIGMEATVDQVWAAQALHQFRAIQQDAGRRKTLRPPLAPTRRWTAIMLLSGAVALGALVLSITDSALAAFIAGAAVTIAALPFARPFD